MHKEGRKANENIRKKLMYKKGRKEEKKKY